MSQLRFIFLFYIYIHTHIYTNIHLYIHAHTQTNTKLHCLLLKRHSRQNTTYNRKQTSLSLRKSHRKPIRACYTISTTRSAVDSQGGSHLSGAIDSQLFHIIRVQPLHVSGNNGCLERCLRAESPNYQQTMNAGETRDAYVTVVVQKT